ncbi:hypothetical protein LTR37_012981 [Vermiconidia calcicola]|uniref:Uncharacterized protein n=1 Tax=Vermiconidia calcicola TaxID=1690605 RepID=A0ACC3MZ79_9PEZI|nr:hypothetical protein LTR37_012981 [Vermiconidia calcicola]
MGHRHPSPPGQQQIFNTAWSPARRRPDVVLLVISCVDDGSTTNFRYNLANAASGSATPTLEAFAPLIQIVYQQTDVDAHTIVYPTVTVTRAATTNEATDGATGLNTGEQAAIGIGVVALLLLGVAIVFAWLLLRQRRRKTTPQELPGHASGNVVAEKRQSHQPIREIGGRQLNELGGSNTAELPERGYK